LFFESSIQSREATIIPGKGFDQLIKDTFQRADQHRDFGCKEWGFPDTGIYRIPVGTFKHPYFNTIYDGLSLECSMAVTTLKSSCFLCIFGNAHGESLVMIFAGDI
jgi:hypothetical protein